VNLMLFQHCRFPADPIRQAVRICFRISLGLRDFENLLTQWATDLSSAMIRGRTNKFGPFIARRLKHS
jgi:transposase-like protein